MNQSSPRHTLVYWLKRISKAKNMDELNKIRMSIERQISLRFPTPIDIDLSEGHIIELWNSFKEKRKKCMEESPYYKYVNLMAF